MSRNRKNQTAAVRFGPALKAFCLCLFLGASGVGYVYQKDQINTLNERRRQCEVRLDQLRRQNERLSRILASLQAPGEIEARIKKLDLGMAPPQPDQVVRLVDAPLPEPELPMRHAENLYAAHGTGSFAHR
jgi:hypothetical protein